MCRSSCDNCYILHPSREQLRQAKANSIISRKCQKIALVEQNAEYDTSTRICVLSLHNKCMPGQKKNLPWTVRWSNILINFQMNLHTTIDIQCSISCYRICSWQFQFIGKYIILQWSETVARKEMAISVINCSEMTSFFPMYCSMHVHVQSPSKKPDWLKLSYRFWFVNEGIFHSYGHQVVAG